MVVGRGLFLSFFGGILIRQGVDLYSKFHERHEGFTFHGRKKSGKGDADTDLI